MDSTAATPILESQEQVVVSRPYSRVTVWLVIALAGLIIGLWMIGTPHGIQGKADAVGYAICHRIDVRSFQINGRPLPLCARCTGIYLGVMTALTVYTASGRIRTGRIPPLKILAVFGLFIVAIGIDGLNSYFTLFQGYKPIYEPNNTLRLITGMGAGLTMFTMVLPIFNVTVWYKPFAEAPLRNFKELGLLILITLLVIVTVLLKLPALLLIYGLISVVGVLVMFGIIGSVLFVTITRRDASAVQWRDVVIPALVGLTFAILVVGSIDALRYYLTGTWEGFTVLE